MNDYPLTKQGVRNLDSVGPKQGPTRVKEYPYKVDDLPFSEMMVHDIIYDDTAEIREEIRSQFPDAEFEADWDVIHEHRLIVKNLLCSTRRWFKFLIQSGLGTLSIILQMALIEHAKEVGEILDEIDPNWRKKKR